MRFLAPAEMLKTAGVESGYVGEKEVKVAKSEASALAGAWCKKASPRSHRAE
ncbi:hypothetical protein GCM10010361_17530 [Streptomyces olivaceiscleroticus]|uniref:Uncharacterized protein n=1 Tax=Streptomyces olivaceiscleroticus TaxID=68245 RepID=A0ABP3JHL8_9ACTN